LEDSNIFLYHSYGPYIIFIEVNKYMFGFDNILFKKDFYFGGGHYKDHLFPSFSGKTANSKKM